MSSADLWLPGFAGLAIAVVAATLWRIGSAQRALVALQADANLHARYVDQLERLKTPEAIEALAAQLAALALSRPIALRPGLLHIGAEPTPYFTITDTAGVRYFFTTQPRSLRRLRVVRRTDPSRSVCAVSIAARADIAAVWHALTLRYGLAHVALPRRATWHVIAFNPTRRASILVRLQSLLRARRIAEAAQAQAVAVDTGEATAPVEEASEQAPLSSGALKQLSAGEA